MNNTILYKLLGAFTLIIVFATLLFNLVIAAIAGSFFAVRDATGIYYQKDLETVAKGNYEQRSRGSTLAIFRGAGSKEMCAIEISIWEIYYCAPGPAPPDRQKVKIGGYTTEWHYVRGNLNGGTISFIGHPIRPLRGAEFAGGGGVGLPTTVREDYKQLLDDALEKHTSVASVLDLSMLSRGRVKQTNSFEGEKGEVTSYQSEFIRFGDSR